MSYNKEYYERNKDKIRKYQREWLAKNQDKYNKEYFISNMNNWIESNQEMFLFNSAKGSAKRRGLEFNLELKDIVIPEYCPYLGIKLTNIRGKGRIPSNASIDRIDNDKGYIKGNVQIISYQANHVKRDLTLGVLVTYAKNILRLHCND